MTINTTDANQRVDNLITNIDIIDADRRTGNSGISIDIAQKNKQARSKYK